MATYFQWRSKHPENKALYYICGEELALRLEVLDAVVAQYPTADKIQVSSEDSFSVVEDAVLGVGSNLKVVVVTGLPPSLSDESFVKLTYYANQIVKGNIPQTVLVFYSGEINPDTSQARFRPFVEKGRFVECKALTVDNMKRYAQEGYGCSAESADMLLELCSYNFRLLNNELEKLSLLGIPITLELVKRVVVFSADDVFIRYMLTRQMELAGKVVNSVDSDSVAGVLTYLARKLSFLYLLVINDTPGMGAHKLAAILGVQPWQLLEYFAVKKYWTAPQILKSLKLLTSVESQYFRFSSNVLELLVSWW